MDYKAADQYDINTHLHDSKIIHIESIDKKFISSNKIATHIYKPNIEDLEVSCLDKIVKAQIKFIDKPIISVDSDIISMLNKRLDNSYLIKLWSDFLQLKNDNPSFLEGLKLDNLDSNVESLLEGILKLEPKNISLELTPEKSMYYSVDFAEGLNLYVDHFFELSDKREEIEGDDTEVVFQMFRDKKTISLFEGTLSDALSALESKYILLTKNKQLVSL